MYPIKKFTIGELKKIGTCQHRAIGNPILYRLILSPLCFWLQKYIPATIAPNTITWIGGLSMLISYIFNTIFDPNLTEVSIPLSLLNIICILTYILTDSLDGIHARNTKQSSQIGKILDHFIDSFSTFACFISLASALQLGHTTLGFVILLTMLLGFYIAEFSEKYTGFLKFSIISGATEGLFTIVGLHILRIFCPSILNHALYTDLFIKKEYKVAFWYLSSSIYIISLFLFLTYDYITAYNSKTIIPLIQDILRSLSFILCISFYLTLQKEPFIKFSFLATATQGFSICYLEEYLSIMSKAPIEYRVFVFSCLILILQGFVSSYLKNSYNFIWILIFASSCHFVLRVGSILAKLSKTFNTKIFGKKI